MIVANFVFEKFYRNSIVKLLYRASTNGWASSNFHSCCDNKGMTLTIIKTITNRIFGGFTTVSWDSSSGYKTDNHSFLFSVDERAKYPIINTFTHAIYCNSGYGPTFANHNIYVADNSNANTSSYVRNDYAYNVKKADGSAYVLTGGSSSF